MGRKFHRSGFCIHVMVCVKPDFRIFHARARPPCGFPHLRGLQSWKHLSYASSLYAVRAPSRSTFITVCFRGETTTPPGKRVIRTQNAPEALKVCLQDRFVISTTRSATANPRYGFGPSFQVI